MCCSTRERKQGLLFDEGGGANWFLKPYECGVCQWVGPEGWLKWSVHCLGGAMCRDHVKDPAFALSTSEMIVDLQPICVLFIIAPAAHAWSYFWSLTMSLYFVEGVKPPKFQPVSFSLTFHWPDLGHLRR